MPKNIELVVLVPLATFEPPVQRMAWSFFLTFGVARVLHRLHRSGFSERW